MKIIQRTSPEVAKQYKLKRQKPKGQRQFKSGDRDDEAAGQGDAMQAKFNTVRAPTNGGQNQDGYDGMRGIEEQEEVISIE